MVVCCTKVDPTKNITLLVHTPVEESLRRDVAQALLLQLGGEQVGYLLAPKEGYDGHLQMAGGEFCGNASISLGAWLARQAELQPGQTRTFLLEVSGAAQPVSVKMQCTGKAYLGTVDMPLPLGFGMRSFAEGDFFTVELPGITHVFVPRAVWGKEASKMAEQCIRRWCDSLAVPALGVILTDEAEHTIRPLVYVPASGTLVWEQGCGSGSAAYGVYCAFGQRRSVSVGVRQPGGVITAAVGWEKDRVTGLAITGQAVIEETKTLEVLQKREIS